MDPSRLSASVAAAARTLAVDQVTAEAVEALRAAGIEPVLLKGPTFAGWLYGGGDLRAYVDTDLLVEPSDQVRAGEVLAGLGFADPMRDARPNERDDHSRTFYRPGPAGEEQEIDLHFTLAGSRSDPSTVWDVLTGALDRVEVGGTGVAALALPARSLHVALHAAQDGRATEQPVHDLRRALTVVDDDTWRRAVELAEQIDAVAAFTAGMERLPEGTALLARLDVTAPDATYERLRRGTPPPMAIGLARLLQRRDAKGIAVEIGRELVPTPSFMRAWSSMARRGRLGLLMAYIWRPIALAAGLPRAVVAYRRARRG